MVKNPLFICLIAICSWGMAQEEDSHTGSETGPWSGNVDLGGTYLQGNSDLVNVFGGFEINRCFDNASNFRFGAKGAYGRSEGIKDKQWVRAEAQYNFAFNDLLYGGLHSDYWHDSIADLRYRAGIDPVLGIYLIKNPRATLTLESGPAYILKNQGGIRESFFALRFVEKFDFRISKKAKFWQSLEYTPEASDFGDYQAVAEAGIQTCLTPAVAVKVFAQDRYDSEPENRRQEHDLGLYLALSYGVNRPKKFTATEARSYLKKCDEGGWRFAGTVGASRLTGNSESTVFSAAVDGLRRGKGRESGVGLSGSYANNDEVTTAEQVGGYFFYNRDRKGQWYFGSRLDSLHDQVADIDYRFNLGPHVGYRIIDQPETLLKVESGPGFTYEQQGNIESGYATVRAGEYFDHCLSPDVKLLQSVEYIGSLEDSDDYNLVGKAGVDATICKSWSWSNKLVYKYDNVPAAGLDEYDLSLQSGLKWEF